ncbi:protein FAM186A [Octodon degus]|uniref:Protein FAM186A n=1 Tax=Octodon degus TaxID=10160 RepID=A0A6P3VC16_OCTDE|nr:protein FAM186A [Octodon degus]
MFSKKRNDIGNDSESEKEVENSRSTKGWSRTALDLPVVPRLEIPFSVQAVISRIEQAQLLRAREDINVQLGDIMNNVNRIITRYIALDRNLSPERKISHAESKKTQRNLLLEKMTACAKAADLKEKTLVYMLSWLEEWSAILSDITLMDVEEHHHWIAQMEMLPDVLKAINNNVKLMCKISRAFLEDKKKQKKKMLSRGTLWKSWKERATKRPATAHALRPDQIISDQLATSTKVAEIQDMLQELIGTAMFNKLETSAINYIASTILNFYKALNTLNDELKIMNFQNAIMYVEETKEDEKDISLKIMQDLSEQNEMLTQKLKDAEEKYEQLIRSKVVSGPRAHIASPTFTSLKVPPGLSPQSSVAIEDTMDSILTKEFENIDEPQRKGTKSTGKKWDAAVSYTPQVEMTPDLTDQQHILPEKKRKIVSHEITGDNISLKRDDDKKDGTVGSSPQNKKFTKDPHSQETSESNLSAGKDEQKGLETKPGQYSEQQTLEKKKKRRKSSSEAKSKSSTESKSQHISSMETKNQEQKSGKSMWEQFKPKPEYSPGKGPVPSEAELELTTKLMKDKDTRSEQTEPFRTIKADFTSEPQKVETQGKKRQIFSGTTTSKEEKTEEEMYIFTKQAPFQQLAKAQSKVTKETLASPDGKSEQSNIELFQKAILAFLKEKIDSTGKPLDKKRVLKEEELLIKAEGEKLGVIEAKMEEYFQKVAETVAKILRKYKDTKMEGQVGEKRIKQKQGLPLMQGSPEKELSINVKPEVSSFLSNESTDLLINTLLQMILAEMESERDVPNISLTENIPEEKGKRQQEKYLQGQEQMPGGADLKHLWKSSQKTLDNLEAKKALLQVKKIKEGPQGQKQRQEEEMGREGQTQGVQKQTQQDEKQKQWKSKRDEQKTKQQQLEAQKQKMKEGGVPLEEEREKSQQIQKEMWLQDLKMSRGKDDKEKLSEELEDLKRQRPNTAKYQMTKRPEELVNMITQNSVKLSPRGKSTMKNKTQLYQGKKMQINLKTLESFPEGKYPQTDSPITSTQSFPTGTSLDSRQPLTKYITPSPQQAQDQEITLTSRKAKGLEVTLTQQAQVDGITLTPEQVQAQGITLTPQQAKDLGITQTPQQAEAQGIIPIPRQAKDVGMTLRPQQVQAQGITLTPQQAKDLGITLTPQQLQAQGITLTPQQAQDLGITLTPQQAEAQGIIPIPRQAKDVGMTLTPQQVKAQGITLTTQQAKDLGFTLTPQQAQVQAQGITLTPQQAQDLGITLTPQQVQAQGKTLTPQQAKDLGTALTHQQALAQGITLTPQQAKDLGITLTPQQIQAQGITLTPQQAQAQGITLTPQQDKDLGITLTPQQAQNLGIILTPQQAPVQGITLTPQQAKDLGITLTPQQIEAQGITLTPQQAKDLGITLTPQQIQAQGMTQTPQQAQNLGITLIPQQAQAQITLTPQQAKGLGITVTPQEAQVQGITLTPQQAEQLGITLTPQQAQAQGIILTPQQAKDLGITLTPQQGQAQGITLTPQQAKNMGITLTPQQAQAQGITLTPQQAQDLGLTLTSQQAAAQRITLTPQQAQDLGITLTPQQIQSQGITLTPQQATDLGITLTPQQRITLTPQQALNLGITLTPQQVLAQGISVTPQQAKDLGITLSPQQAQYLGISLMPQQALVQGITLTPQQAKDVGITLTPQQAHNLGFTLSPQQIQARGIPLTWQKLATFVPFALRPSRELKASFSTQKSITSRLFPRARPRLPLTSSASPAEISMTRISSPLQKLTPPLSQAPFTPGKHVGMNICSAPGRLLGPQILPTSRQMLVVQGQAIPMGSVPQEVSPAPEYHPISGAPVTTEQPLQPEALSSDHFFMLRGLLTPSSLQSSQATLTLRPPLLSSVPPIFGQIPRIWAPLSPGQTLVPGVSSISREELRESEPLAFSEWPQGIQPPATPEKPLQTPPTFRPPLAPQSLPEHVSPLWLLPSPRHPSTLWASPTSEKPLRVLPSSVTQQRLAIVSSIKSKSAVVQARATDFKVSQAPFTTKKFQISKTPEAYEETQILQDTCVTEPSETLQSFLTSYRAPVPQSPYTDEAVLPTFMKPVTPLPSRTTWLPKTPYSSPSEGDQKSQFPSADQPWILTSVLGIKKHEMMVPPSSPKEIVEKRYFVEVEAQRKNLIVLNEATKTFGLPLQQQTTARNLIIGTLRMDTVRLGYLVRKYIAYKLIQRARNNIIKRLKAIQNTGRGYETKCLYIMLSRMDEYQKRVMGAWTEKQKYLEQKRNQGLKKMVHLFSQFQKMYKLNLSQPIPLKVAKKQTPASTKSAPQPFLELLIEEDKTSDIFHKFRQKEAVRQAIWNADLSTSSYPITKKTSVTSLWAQMGGYPDIPRLLQLDIQSTFRKSLASIQSQSQKILK